VVVIGGGPAGSTVARLLTQWGLTVTLLTTACGCGPGFAECLPPSTRKLFAFLGVLDAVDRAGFFRTTGNTVWWGTLPFPAGASAYDGRVELYPEGWGYQVLRSEFDSLLLGLAGEAGVQVQFGKAIGTFKNGTFKNETSKESGPHIELRRGGTAQDIKGKFIVDCSGRAGVLGRYLRAKPSKPRTIALCATWKSESGWKLPDPSHTLVESYGDGWAWSVPLSPSVRQVAVMVDARVDHRVSAPALDTGLTARYHAELAKTSAFRRIFSQSLIDRAPWGRPATCYTSTRFCGPGFLLAGDTGSMIDPLSSFGVKKAMVSAWVGAVVVNTCLRNPAMQDSALRFYEDRERQVYEDWQRLSASWFRQGGEYPFWDDRAGVPGSAAPTLEQASDAVRAAWEALKRKPAIRLRRCGLPLQPAAAIEGNQIVLRDAMAGEVNLVRLCQIAEQHSQVPDVFEAYNRTCAPVALPQFLAALATLIAEKVLTDQP
jgi:flavin-dependent dehydrogenase